MVVAEAQKGKLKVGFGLVDGLEAVFYGLGALAVLLVGVLLGLRAIYRLAGLPGLVPAVAAGVLIVAALVRDFRRRAWSVVSIAALVAYLCCFGIVIWWDATGV